MMATPYEDLALPEVLVDCNPPVEHLRSLLEQAAQHGQLVLLHGVAGIGKTVAATRLFNTVLADHEMHRCFYSLNNGTELSELHKLLDSILHQQLLLAQRPILLVLDNVQTATADGQVTSQLSELLSIDWVAALVKGSIVLVTSRDERACAMFEQHTMVHKINMQPLTQQHALKLLCSYAYGADHPVSKADSLTLKPVLQQCGKLPLALEAVGRHLEGLEDKGVFFRRLDEALLHVFKHEDVGGWGHTRTVFQALQEVYQQLSCSKLRDALPHVVTLLRGHRWDMVDLFVNASCQKSTAFKELAALGLVYCLPAAAGSTADNPQEQHISRFPLGTVQVHSPLLLFCKNLHTAGNAGQTLATTSPQQASSSTSPQEPLPPNPAADAPMASLKELVANMPYNQGFNLQDVVAKGNSLRLQYWQIGKTGGTLARIKAALSRKPAWTGKPADISILKLQDCFLDVPLALPSSKKLQWLCLENVNGREPLPEAWPVQLQLLQQLKVLVLEGVPLPQASLQQIANVTSLMSLELSNCSQLNSISFASALPSLQQLFVSRCKDLVKVKVGCLSALTQLVVVDCLSLMKLQPAAAAATLHVGLCSRLESVLLLGLGQLSCLHLVACEQLAHLDGLQGLQALQELVMVSIGNKSTALGLQSMPDLGKLNGLQRLEVHHCSKFTAIPSLPASLRVLVLQFNVALKEVDLTQAPLLQHVDADLPSLLVSKKVLSGDPGKPVQVPQQAGVSQVPQESITVSAAGPTDSGQQQVTSSAFIRGQQLELPSLVAAGQQQEPEISNEPAPSSGQQREHASTPLSHMSSGINAVPSCLDADASWEKGVYSNDLLAACIEAADRNFILLHPPTFKLMHLHFRGFLLLSALLIACTYRSSFAPCWQASRGNAAMSAWHSHSCGSPTFFTINFLALVLALLVLPMAAAALILLRHLRPWPATCSTLPAMPPQMAAALPDPRDVAKIQQYVQAMLLIRHAQTYGVPRPFVWRSILVVWAGCLTMLLASVYVAVGAAVVVLHNCLAGRPVIFAGAVSSTGFWLALALSAVSAAHVFGRWLGRHDNKYLEQSPASSLLEGRSGYWKPGNRTNQDKEAVEALACRKAVVERAARACKDWNRSDFKANSWFAAAQMAREEDPSIKFISRTALELQAEMETEYATIQDVMIKLSTWEDLYGRFYAVKAYLDPGLRDAALQHRQTLEKFWDKVNKQIEAGMFTLEDFFGKDQPPCSWLSRAREYRLRAEQLDIARWYYRDKHRERGQHYLSNEYICTSNASLPFGTVEEYHASPLVDSTGTPLKRLARDNDGARWYGNHEEWLVKWGVCRPDRFRLIQEAEARRYVPQSSGNYVGQPGPWPRSSLELAWLLRQHLGNTIAFSNTEAWPAELRVALLGAVPAAADTAENTSSALGHVAADLEGGRGTSDAESKLASTRRVPWRPEARLAC